MRELSNGLQLQDDFCKSLWLQSLNAMPSLISRTRFCAAVSSEPLINWLSSLIRFLRLLVHPQLICATTTVPPPSQSSSCRFSQPWISLARQIQELSLQAAELTRERNSSRHQRYKF
ncbi:hypothetical protein TNCV_3215421 [Trichonephila clavipes]|nr:hypothetical protein TNCV_3215421 [Trichonephila clavipes]